MMRMRTMVWLCVVTLGFGLMSPVMAQTAPTGQLGVLTASDLIYQGATIKTQVDVNGAAAVQLVGGILDAATAAVEAQANAAAQSGAPQPPEDVQMKLAMVAPVLGPARDIIKSLDQITVLMMAPQGEVSGDAFISHYQDMMLGRGWVPLMTVRGQGMPAIASMMAPEGKGVFLAAYLSPGDDTIAVALITTTKPIGDLLGQLASAGQGVMPHIMAMMQRPKPVPPPPPAPPAKHRAPAKKPAPKKK
jgi:hypothetical protein